MKWPSPSRLMTFACLLALCALGLIIWALLDPRPIPVIAAMSVGQVVGTLSFATYILVILGDLRSRFRRVAPSESERARGADTHRE